MKKGFIIVLFAFILVGCGKKNTLTCKSEETVQDNIYKTEVKLTYKGDKVSKARSTWDVTLSEQSMKYYDSYYNSFEQTFDDLKDKDGIKFEMKKTDKGYKVIINVDYNVYEGKIDMINSSLNKEQAKIYYENAKYTCK